MKQYLYIIMMLMLLSGDIAKAQKILFQKETNGFAMNLKTLSNKNYVSANLLSFDNYDVSFYLIDKKFRNHTIKKPSYPYLYVFYDGIICTDSNFYIPWETVKPVNGSGILDQPLIGKYDNEGNEIWLKKLSYASFEYNAFFNNLIYDNNQLKVLYVDSSGSVVFETFDTDGNTLQSRLIPDLKADLIYNLFRTGTNRFSTFYRNSLEKHLFLLTFNDSGQILQLKKTSTTQPNSFYNVAIQDNENLYAIITYKDPVTLAGSSFLTKFDALGNIAKQSRIFLSDEAGAGASHIVISTDHQLYVTYNLSNTQGFIESHISKYDLNFDLKWDYVFDRYINGLDLASCNGILVAKQHRISGNLYSTIIEAIQDPDLGEVCDRCDITVFPNPTTDGNITMQTGHPDVAIVKTEWYDASGRLIWKSLGGANRLFADMEPLAPGMYNTITTCDNDKYAQRRVIIAK